MLKQLILFFHFNSTLFLDVQLDNVILAMLSAFSQGDIIATNWQFLCASFNTEIVVDTASLPCSSKSYAPRCILYSTCDPPSHRREFTESCMTKLAVVLINGTSPGPEIRLVEGRTFWIRVYNDMEGQNLAMVPNSVNRLPYQSDF